ncbi:MAG: ABC transporter substrate-binding protein [Anaerolineales bacterium]
MKKLVLWIAILSLLVPVAAMAQDDEDRPLMGVWDECATPDALSGEIPLGVVFTLTGGGSIYGNPQQQGVQLAVQQINESGYLGEATLNAIYEDSATSGEGAIAAFEKLINEDNAVAILGPTLSTEAFAADPIAQEAGVPVMGVSNTANGITEMGDFVFRNSLPEASVIPGNLEQAVDILGIQSVGVLYSDNDDFTVSGFDVFVESLDNLGVDILAEETFSTGDVDFNAQLTNVLALEPDAIVLSILIAEAVPMINQIRDLGFEGPIIGGNGVNTPAVADPDEGAGENAEGVIVGAAWHITNPSDINQDFVEQFTEFAGERPGQFVAQSYTGAWLMATAIRCANSADSADIRDSLAAIEGFESPLGTFAFDEDRNPVHDPVAQIVIDGEFELLSAETAAQTFGE